jgi:tetratricopeptide (TPR) repeat protein
MESGRLEILKEMVARNPADSFSRYGLAMEYRGSGMLEEAVREFRALINLNPDYVPAYYQFGQALESLGRTGEAGEVYTKGIDIANRKGDAHARSELQAALDLCGI